MPRRVYWFSASPSIRDEAETIGAHIEGLHDLLDAAWHGDSWPSGRE